jgi:N4-gp56 family major capsid protein
MANTNVLSGLELTKWQKDFWREYVRDTGFAPYMGASPTDIIHVINDLDTDGYTIRVPLVGRLQGTGVTGDTMLGGQEESLDQYYQDISWEFYRHALSITKKQKKKSAVDLLGVMRPLLKEWAAELKKYQIISTFHQMSSGASFENATTAEKNTFAANNVDRILFGATTANYSATHATGLATIDNTADKLTTAQGSLARFMARQARPHIRPFKNGTQGREYYVMFCHPLCFRDLKQDTVMVNANRDARGRENSGMDNNPIFQDGDLIYDGVIYREIPEFYMGRQGNSSINAATHLVGVGAGSIDVGVNFLCGAQALGVVNKQAPLPTKKNEDDYGFVDGTGIELAHGYSKLRWNNGSGTNKDCGMVTIYSAAVA